MDWPCHNLSDEEIKFIRNDVENCGISYSHLEEELIDHICCMVEEYLDEGYNFDAAYSRVKKYISFDTLKDIEIQTLILINKKIQAMKTTLKLAGIIGLVTVAVASAFKILHLPGAGILLTLGIITLTFGYVPVLIFALKREKLLKRSRYLAFTGISAAFLFLISLLFTVMHWPLREYTIYGSWILIFIFLILLFVHILRSEDNRIIHLSLLLFFSVMFILDITLYVLSQNNPRISHLTIESNLDESIGLFDNSIQAIYLDLESVDDEKNKTDITDFREHVEQLIMRIENIKTTLFASRSEQEQFNRKFIKDYSKINIMESEAKDLEKEVNRFRDYLIANADSIPHLNKYISRSIRFGYLEFNNSPPIVYNNLTKLIRDIKIAEFEILNRLNHN